MGRIGVSEYQVAQTASKLKAEGINPSVDAVRVALGNTGSRSTINKYLQLWRDAEARRSGSDSNLGEHLRGVISEQADQLLSVLEARAAAAFDAKQRQFERIQQEQDTQIQRYIERVANADDQILVLRNERTQLQARVSQLQSQRMEAVDQAQKLRESLAREIGRREALEAQLNLRDKEIAQLKKSTRAGQSKQSKELDRLTRSLELLLKRQPNSTLATRKKKAQAPTKTAKSGRKRASPAGSE